MTPRAAVILAAGRGSRMRSRLPKALLPLGGRALLDWSLDLARDLRCDPIVLVVAPDASELTAIAAARARVCVQEHPSGTADAVRSAAGSLEGFEGHAAVFYVDTPLVSSQTVGLAFAALEAGSALAVLGFEPGDPGGYGRLIVDSGGRLERIVEAREASPAERRTRLCNSGVMAGRWPQMAEWLARVGDENAAGEHYLTDLAALAFSAGQPAACVRADAAEMVGINTPIDLAEAEAAFQGRARSRAMASGVQLLAPETIYFSWDTQLAPGVVVEPYVVFGPGVRVATATRIRSFSHVEGVEVGEECRIGPFARLRPGTRIGAGAGVGNFVEVKQATLGEGSKVGHLAYIGDGEVGAKVNIGAGTIFCNYDGTEKHETRIGDDAFVGSNASLVAPVTIGPGAYVGSGSVITEDVPADALALGRARQSGKPGWASRFRRGRSGS